ncbi:MAG: hypothetical protein QOF99_412 [Pseudonocardiales bacterium]|jgi:hypothetical protein|nr:hypothetical protein [Pseudonocardiales bacterium]MDT7693861.1 hypothetical protein [Pseudonocardiales bacterium]
MTSERQTDRHRDGWALVTAAQDGNADAFGELWKRYQPEVQRFISGKVRDQDIQAATSKVLKDHPKLTGKGGSRNLADPFVIGLAHARGGIVVTEESMSGSLARPRIPDVCAAMNSQCVGLVGFIRKQGWTFG